MLTQEQIAQLIEDIRNGTYTIEDAFADIASGQYGEDVRKAMYAGLLVCRNDGEIINGQVVELKNDRDNRGAGRCYAASRTMVNERNINVNFTVNVAAGTFIKVKPENVENQDANLMRVRLVAMPDASDTSVFDVLAESIPVDKWTTIRVSSDYEMIRYTFSFWDAVSATAYGKLLVNADLKRDARNNDYLFEPPRLQFAAHRGARDFYPENSLPAFEKACQLGYDWIWLANCRQSADGTWYCIHDKTVDRTTNGSGNVAEMTDEELDELYLRDGDTEYPELHIPKVSEAVTLIRRYSKKIVLGLGELNIDRAKWDSYINLISSLGMANAVFYAPEAQIVKFKYFSENWHGCVFLDTSDAEDVTALIDRMYAAGFTNCSVEIPYSTTTEELVDYAHRHGYKYVCSSVPIGSGQAEAIENMRTWRVDIAQGIFEFEEA